MKTAMIQFLEWLENSSNVKDDILNWELVKENALDKEKEQIINAHLEGWSDAYDYLKSDSNDQARQAEDYYNQTYNN